MTRLAKLPSTRFCEWLRYLILLFAVVAASASNSSDAGESDLRRSSGMLGEGTSWATPWYAIDSDDTGPTVLITGGMHGNEPAGSEAAKQIRHWSIARGKLVVIPSVNRLGLKAEMRWFPEQRNDRSQRDLNRNFPKLTNLHPRTPLCETVWEFVESVEPDFVFDLHEGFDFHVSNSKSVGSSVIFSRSDEQHQLAEKMLDAVNQTVDDDGHLFVALSRSGAAQGSLVRACADVLGVRSFILETTFKEQPLSFRTFQHRVMVSTALKEIGLLDSDWSDQLTASDDREQLSAGLFDDAGTTTNGLKNVSKALSRPEFEVVRFGPKDLSAATLSQFDVLIFPGGSGSRQGRAIGPDGREVIRDYVNQGGGVVGICAGAYLCSAHYDWSLHVINTSVFNKTIDIPGVGKKSMWFRGGPLDVEMELTADGEEVFSPSGKLTVRYQNGPIVGLGPDAHLPEWTPLAWFRSEVAKYEPQEGTMIDSPAIVVAPFGSGRVVSISPHPEATPGLETIIAEAVKWASQGEDLQADSEHDTRLLVPAASGNQD
ncbi:BPL-N domain-containing protein [Thalassoglobus sp. JC818]|uniref:BPL-N domain-containing protein n=1 Tax=Thalassoglobus sp. JC818 TaxID=3232136 RepID=UPI003457B4F7